MTEAKSPNSDVFWPLLDHPVRAVVIGYGRWGRLCHSPLIEAAPQMQLHGIMSGNAEKRAQIEHDHKCRAYENFNQVIEDDTVDLVILATPSDTHCPLSVQALNAGKHAVTDKVMTLSLEECDQMIQAARDNNRLLSVFQNRRRDGDFLTLQNAIANGDLGMVNWVEMAWQRWGSWSSWRGQVERGGGKFYDLGAHLVDQMQVLFPQKIESVYCRQHHDFPGMDIDSECLFVLTFEGGATGIIDVSSRDAIEKPRFRVHGEKATWVKYGLDPQEDALMAGDINSAIEPPELYAHIKGPEIDERMETLPGRWRDYYENIADALQNGATPIVTVDSARRTMMIIDAALKSAHSGDVVKF